MIVLAITTIRTCAGLHEIETVSSIESIDKTFIAMWVRKLATSAVITLSCL